MMVSIIPFRFKSAAVSSMTSAASSARFSSFHKIEAKPSGDNTEYIAFSNIRILSATLNASAPPLPPSLNTMAITGVRKPEKTSKHWAMASACPRSSAPFPGYAPEVSTIVMMGR